MTTTTIRASSETRAALNEMARASGLSMVQVLERAVEAYRRQQKLEALNAAYATLYSAPEAWRELDDERTAWDATISDGLEG